MDAIELRVAPCPKPRQSRSDRWNKRPCVVKYRDFCDKVLEQMGDRLLPDAYEVAFYIPIPKSYPAKKKRELPGQPHTLKPDLDNLIKALQDAVFSKRNKHATSDDSHIWSVSGSKFWAAEGEGRILVRQMTV